MVLKPWLKLICGIFAIVPAMAIAADDSHSTMRDGFNQDLQQLLQQRVAAPPPYTGSSR